MNVEIVKVSNDRPSFRPSRHGNSPKLYLELVENKDRVKQDLINKEYVPAEEPEVTLSDMEDEIPVPEKYEESDHGEEKSEQGDNLSVQNSVQSDDHNPDKNLDGDDNAKIDSRINEMFKMDSAPTEKAPPNLNQLPGFEKKYYRNIDNVSKTEIDEEDEKRQLLFKFDLMKKQYKEFADIIPVYTVHSDLRLIQKSYDSTLQRVILDSSVEDYKGYFQKACFGIEFVMNYFGFDINGFTGDQMSKMNTYERLLVELCAKHYNPGGSSIPVELRLFGMILANAALFIGMKIMVKKLGGGSGDSAPPIGIPFSSPSGNEPRKMKGPQNIDDIEQKAK